MYVATSLDKSWLRSAQSKLYARSRNEPDYVWRKLWGWSPTGATCGWPWCAYPRTRGRARQAWTGGR